MFFQISSWVHLLPPFQIVKHLLPSEGSLIGYVFDKNHFVIKCGSRFFRALFTAAAVDPQYREMASEYIEDFAKTISPVIFYNALICALTNNLKQIFEPALDSYFWLKLTDSDYFVSTSHFF